MLSTIIDGYGAAKSGGMRRFPPSSGETCLSCLLLVVLPAVLALAILAVLQHL
jgi:hypothetical protein